MGTVEIKFNSLLIDISIYHKTNLLEIMDIYPDTLKLSQPLKFADLFYEKIKELNFIHSVANESVRPDLFHC